MIAGRYSIVREIGRGGAGAVFLATDEVLGRQVAIKRIGILPGSDSPDLARAEREARLAAALNHPHVVAVFDLVEDSDAHYLVMEYVDGATLSRLVADEGALDERTIARLLAQACDALAAAHEAGIVHRDVKPSNILVTKQGQAKLTDFGIARAMQDASLTVTGLVSGSPAYLAPEVASGHTATVASDMWSLGATLFHCITGRPPYAMEGNLVGGLYKIVHDEPPRVPDPGPFAAILAATMVHDPDRRWSSARVRDELQRIVRGEVTRQDEPTLVAPIPMASNPATPMEVVAPSVAPGSGPTPTPAAGRRTGPTPGRPARGRLTPVLLTVAACLALVVIGLIGWQALRGTGEGPSAGNDTPPTQTSGEESSQTPTPDTTSADSEQTTKDVEKFIKDYLHTVTKDPSAGFAMLTPDFQSASGGLSRYRGWWDTVEKAKVSDIKVDPQSLTVTYNVEYTKVDKSKATDAIRLTLVQQGDTYLISGEG